MLDKIFPKIHQEGYKFLIIAALITIVLYFLSGFLGLISLLLTVWILECSTLCVGMFSAMLPTLRNEVGCGHTCSDGVLALSWKADGANSWYADDRSLLLPSAVMRCIK